MSYQTEAMLRALVLEPCPICGVEGPKVRLREHLDVEHRVHDKEPGGDKQFIVAVPVRFRPRLELLRLRTGASFTKLLAIALDDYYGCHDVSAAQEARG